MHNVKYELEDFENLSFKKRTEMVFSTGAKLFAKFHKGHLFELYCVGRFFVQVRYTGNKPDKIISFLPNDKKVDFYIIDESEKEKV